jgi:hypothetical protein
MAVGWQGSSSWALRCAGSRTSCKSLLVHCLADDGSGPAKEQQLGFGVRMQQTILHMGVVIAGNLTGF